MSGVCGPVVATVVGLVVSLLALSAVALTAVALESTWGTMPTCRPSCC